MAGYGRLFAVQLKRSLLLSAQYRWDFLIGGALSLVWTALGLVPLYVALHGRPPVDGWTYEGALVVVGWFTLLKGVLEGSVNPSLVQVVEQIRLGTLDFVLLKPADAQFLVSTARFELFRLVDIVAAIGILAWAFARMGRAPTLLAVLTALALLVVAIAVLYSLWILVVAAAFWVVRLDNLSYLFASLFDFARWPVSIFKGIYGLVFTFVIPIAVMTTYPAQALLGTLSAETALFSVVGSLTFAVVARVVWTRAIGRYTSASS